MVGGNTTCDLPKKRDEVRNDYSSQNPIKYHSKREANWDSQCFFCSVAAGSQPLSLVSALGAKP